ncbi:MAG TPA: NADH-quinone oxidoreductase subunit J [Polyangia bacterium]
MQDAAAPGSLLAPLASGEGALFLLLSIAVIGMSIFCMTRRNPVTAVMSLVATFFGLAALYATLSAHFLAVLQVLVYAGAIMVLFIFVVMILNREESTLISLRGLPTRVLGVVAGGYLLLVFCQVVIPDVVPAPTPIPETFGTVASIGNVLFRDFIFPFESISVLLLVAVVGGVTISRSQSKEKAAVDAAEKRIAIAHLSGADYPEPAEPLDDGEHDDAQAAGGGHH